MNTEPLGRSTAYTEKRVLAIYILLLVAVTICTVVFVVKDTMDNFQIILTVATFGCVIGGLYNHIVNSKHQVILYDDYFEMGGKRIRYEDVKKIECVRGVQMEVITGRGAQNKHTALVGNGDALVYLINRKRKELRKKKK